MGKQQDHTNAARGSVSGGTGAVDDDAFGGDVPQKGDYRLITIDPHGSVLSVIALSALSDMEAVAQAGLLAADFAMDLWDGLRFVEHFAASVPHTVRVVLDSPLVDNN